MFQVTSARLTVYGSFWHTYIKYALQFAFSGSHAVVLGSLILLSQQQERYRYIHACIHTYRHVHIHLEYVCIYIYIHTYIQKVGIQCLVIPAEVPERMSWPRRCSDKRCGRGPGRLQVGGGGGLCLGIKIRVCSIYGFTGSANFDDCLTLSQPRRRLLGTLIPQGSES